MASVTAQVSLDDVSAAGAGTTVDFLTAKRNVSVVLVPSGAPTTGLVYIEVSMDGSNWAIVRTIELSGRTNYAASFTGVAFRYWRANIARTVAGGAVRAAFMEADS
jgi:hypothetical protein